MAQRQDLPEHLLPFIAEQHPELYTPIDHASWRYILRVSQAFFKDHAHQKYLDGLRETGISTERIPLISEMDEKLQKFGWRAIGVSGFIPPMVFLEFQALGYLPIACEMRKLENLAYTPAPDIVHEAAGHAPIIADPEYAAYLGAYGQVAKRAIFSKQDMDLYEAIRNLSEVKEDPHSGAEKVKAAQDRFERAKAANDYVSEATQLARMSWWTIEYGLVGPMHAPLIYGAGLLSSVSESFHTTRPEVRKIPFTLDCLNVAYDITRPQPQLFVSPSFKQMTEVLNEFAKTMAFRRGGLEGLAKAKLAETVTTTVLDTGLQISGVLNDFMTNSEGVDPVYLFFRGPVQLGFKDREIPGHSTARHSDGFGAPLGKPKQGWGKFEPGAAVDLTFQTGVRLTGIAKSETLLEGRPLIRTFTQCTVKLGDRVLFDPAWGEFDLAIGERVGSVFGGAADRVAYLKQTGGFGQAPRMPKTNLTEENRALGELYAEVRRVREAQQGALSKVSETLSSRFSDDWLLRLELLECAARLNFGGEPWVSTTRSELQRLRERSPTHRELIDRGLELL